MNQSGTIQNLEEWREQQKREDQMREKVMLSMDASPLFDHWCKSNSPVGNLGSSSF